MVTEDELIKFAVTLALLASPAMPGSVVVCCSRIKALFAHFFVPILLDFLSFLLKHAFHSCHCHCSSPIPGCWSVGQIFEGWLRNPHFQAFVIHES
ncbi:hypothetical protein BJ138DRAFT_425352 [Hygrophoropsis aurantiaca]|uniref:Uncharacterized protein n=1 Tax=Hygrophoropsis aurantiaca TaxID=72124 RepID=A0ACB8A3F7_9AGAM|nr:hypothetical protein BJ138DRAFT_425352 [Hygrophoropsis aurantiaca]